MWIFVFVQQCESLRFVSAHVERRLFTAVTLLKISRGKLCQICQTAQKKQKNINSPLYFYDELLIFNIFHPELLFLLIYQPVENISNLVTFLHYIFSINQSISIRFPKEFVTSVFSGMIMWTLLYANEVDSTRRARMKRRSCSLEQKQSQAELEAAKNRGFGIYKTDPDYIFFIVTELLT